jgi:hypothetical protein
MGLTVPTSHCAHHTIAMALKVKQPRNTQLDLFDLLFILILLGASLTHGMGLGAFLLS